MGRPRTASRKPRNHALDLMRVVAFCGVVSLHTVTPDGPLSVAMNVLARFAVPFFFAIAGFFSLGATAATIARRLRHAAALCASGVAIYAVTALIGLTPTWSDLAQLGGGWRALAKNFVLWNDYPAAYPLWFLFALLYVYACYGAIARFSIRVEYLVGGGVALFVARVLLAECSGAIAPLGMQVRSWLLSGVPHFCLGLLLRRHEETLRKLAPGRIALLAFAGCVCCAVECARFGLQEGYVGTVAIVVACFAACLAYPLTSLGSTPLVRLLRGGDVCLIAYLVHYVVISMLDKLSQIPVLGVLGTLDPLRFMLVIVCSLAMGAAATRLMSLNAARRRMPQRQTQR